MHLSRAFYCWHNRVLQLDSSAIQGKEDWDVDLESDLLGSIFNYMASSLDLTKCFTLSAAVKCWDFNEIHIQKPSVWSKTLCKCNSFYFYHFTCSFSFYWLCKVGRDSNTSRVLLETWAQWAFWFCTVCKEEAESEGTQISLASPALIF